MRAHTLTEGERSATRSTRILFWFSVATAVTAVGRDLLHGDAQLDLGLALQLTAVFMWGAFAAHAILTPTQQARDVVLRLGLVLEFVRAAIVLVWLRLPAAAVWIPGVGLGVAAIGVEASHWVRARGAEREQSWIRLQLILLGPLSAAVFVAGLATLGHGPVSLRSVGAPTYDHALYAFDGTLRFPLHSTPATVIGQLFTKSLLLHAVCSFVYLCAPLALMVTMAGYVKSQLRHRTPTAPDPLIAYLLGGLVFAVTFSVCPATGPAFAFAGAFPAHLPDPDSVSLITAAVSNEFPRNCVPSGHVAFAWLAYLTVCDVTSAPRWLRTGAASFAVLTVLATLGLGEHYLIDLILAVPFMVALRALSVSPTVPGWRMRLVTALVCLGVLVVWVVLLRSSVGFFRRTPPASWCAVVVTVAIPTWLARQWPGGVRILEVSVPDIVPA